MVSPHTHFEKEKSFYISFFVFVIMMVFVVVLSFLNNNLKIAALLCLLPAYFIYLIIRQAVSISLNNDKAVIKSFIKTRSILYNDIDSIELVAEKDKGLDSIVVLNLKNNIKIPLSGFTPGSESLFKSFKYYHEKKTRIHS